MWNNQIIGKGIDTIFQTHLRKKLQNAVILIDDSAI